MSDELKSWGLQIEKYCWVYPKSWLYSCTNEHCEIYVKDLIHKNQLAILGFSADIPQNLRHYEDKPHIAIIECLSCKTRFWFHVNEDWVNEMKEKGLWPADQP